MKCDGCNLESEREEIFKSVNRFFKSKDLILCPACFEKKDNKTNIILIWSYLICGLLSIPFTLFNPTNGVGLLLLNISVFQLFVLFSTVLHELGHAIAGRSVGIRVFGIEIGKGPVLYEFLVAGIRWRIHAIAFGGIKKHENLDSLLLNDIAYSYVLIGKPEFLPKAEICSRLALKQMPWMVYYKGTRGSVLVELGKYDEGLKLLHDAMQNHPEKSGRALNACYIGIAEARRGNLAESRNYFSIARKLDPDCVLLERETILN